MLSLSSLVRWLPVTAVGGGLVAIGVDWFEKAHPTAADYDSTFGAMMGAVASITHLTWFYPSVFLVAGITIGVWIDAFTRQIDGGRLHEQQDLGSDFLRLAQKMKMAVHGTYQRDWPSCIGHLVPEIISTSIAARKKCAMWAPDPTNLEKGPSSIIVYYMTVGRLLQDGHIAEAKSTAAQAKSELIS